MKGKYVGKKRRENQATIHYKIPDLEGNFFDRLLSLKSGEKAERLGVDFVAKLSKLNYNKTKLTFYIWQRCFICNRVNNGLRHTIKKFGVDL